MSVGAINDLVSDQALGQLDVLLEKLGVNTQAMADAIAMANKFNNELGGTKGLNEFSAASNNVVSAMERVATTSKAVTQGQNDIAVATDRAAEKAILAAQRKAEAEEKALNKYLVQLSKQESARQVAYNKEIQDAERQAARLQAISDKAQAEAERKAKVQFSNGSRPISSVEREPDAPMAAGIANQSDYEGGVRLATEATKAESAAMAEQAEIMAGLSTEYRANIELLLTLQAERSENATALKELTVQDAASGERLVFLTAEQLRLKIAIQQTNLALSQQTKQILAEDTSGVQMQARLDELRVAIGNLSKEELENVEIGGVWIAEAKQLDLAIKSLRDSTGDTTKHVGDYARAQGTSSNATILAEKVSAQFVRQLTRMVAQFLLVSVIFGAAQWLFEWIKNLDIFTGRLDQATQNLKALNDVQKDVASNAGDLVGKYRILSDAVKDVTLSDEDRLRAATELKKLFPEELEHSTAQAIANGTEAKSLDALTDSVIKLAKAKAAASQIEKTEGEIIALQIQRDKVNNAKASEIARVPKETSGKIGFGGVAFTQKDQIDAANYRANKANKDIQDQIKIKEQTIKYLEQYGGLQKEAESLGGTPKKDTSDKKLNNEELELQKARLQGAKEATKLILDDESKSYEERLKALKRYVQLSNAIIDTEHAIADKAPDITLTGKKINTQHATNEKAQVSNFDLTETQKLNADALRKQEEAQKKFKELITQFETNITDDIKENLNERLIAIEDANAKEAAVLLNKYQKGKLNEQQYNRDLKILNDKSNEDKIKAELETEQAILAIEQGLNAVGFGNFSQKQIQGTKNNIASKTTQLTRAQTQTKSDEGINDDIKGDKKKKEIVKFANEAIDALNVVQSLIDQNAQAKIDALEREFQQIQQNGEAEKNQIDNSIKSSKEKARETKIIDAQVAQQRIAITNQENKVKEKAAEFDKAASIAKIIQGTAVAIISALSIPIYGEALAIVIGAIGAAQLAVAASAPLPKFEKGGTVSKDGNIITGEAGTELRIDPSGNASFTKDYANISYAKAGTKIINNKELVKMLGKPEPIQYIVNVTNDNKKMEKLLQQNLELQKKQKQPIVKVYNDRFGAYSQQRNY